MSQVPEDTCSTLKDFIFYVLQQYGEQEVQYENFLLIFETFCAQMRQPQMETSKLYILYKTLQQNGQKVNIQLILEIIRESYPELFDQEAQLLEEERDKELLVQQTSCVGNKPCAAASAAQRIIQQLDQELQDLFQMAARYEDQIKELQESLQKVKLEKDLVQEELAEKRLTATEVVEMKTLLAIRQKDIENLNRERDQLRTENQRYVDLNYYLSTQLEEALQGQQLLDSQIEQQKLLLQQRLAAIADSKKNASLQTEQTDQDLIIETLSEKNKLLLEELTEKNEDLIAKTVNIRELQEKIKLFKSQPLFDDAQSATAYQQIQHQAAHTQPENLSQWMERSSLYQNEDQGLHKIEERDSIGSSQGQVQAENFSFTRLPIRKVHSVFAISSAQQVQPSPDNVSINMEKNVLKFKDQKAQQQDANASRAFLQFNKRKTSAALQIPIVQQAIHILKKPKMGDLDKLELKNSVPFVRQLNQVLGQTQIDLNEVLSCHAFAVTDHGEREDVAIIVTSQYFIVTEKNLDKIKRCIKLHEINKLTILDEADQYFLVRARSEVLVFECLRNQESLELSIYFFERHREIVLETSNRCQMQIVERQTFLREANLQSLPPQAAYMNSYQDARMAGFVFIYRETTLRKIFNVQWQETFLVLSDIGLLGFKQRTDYKCYFIPTKNAELKKYENPRGQNKYILEISGISDDRYLIAIQSKLEQNKWYEELQNVINSKREEKDLQGLLYMGRLGDAEREGEVVKDSLNKQ